MNAVTRNSDSEAHFREVQVLVLEDEMLKDGVQKDHMYAFIMSNAPLFRFFATHLPEELKNIWDNANTDEASRIELESQYEELRRQMQLVFAQHFDAETQTALTEAAECGDITTAERILEAHFQLIGRTEE